MHMNKQSGAASSEKEQMITKQRESVKLREKTNSGKSEPMHHCWRILAQYATGSSDLRLV